MRHDIFDTWLTEKRDINYVIHNLPKANFDPEFYERYENVVLAKYNEQLSTLNT